jgi:glycosyltransferase involved in cell wall biosynthesis
MVISYAITTHNETDSLKKLLEFLIEHKDKEDEIVILDDYSDNELTKEILDFYVDVYTIKFEQRHLNNNFAEQKNYLTRMCKGSYIMNIDADEIPHKMLMGYVKDVLKINDVELIWVPRVNTVEGITQEHINQWGWRVNEQGWVNYPDYQARVYKNAEHIKWVRPVHEHIEGAKTYSHLPPQEELSMYHPKTIDKQEQQNNLYREIIR